MAPRPLPQSWSSTPPPATLQWQCAMAPSNGTTSTAPCNGTLVPRPSPISQSGSSPSPPIGSKNPYSYRYLGNEQILIEFSCIVGLGVPSREHEWNAFGTFHWGPKSVHIHGKSKMCPQTVDYRSILILHGAANVIAM